MASGLKPGTKLTSCQDAVDYYASSLTKAGESPAIIEVNINQIDKKRLQPDMNSIKKPDLKLLMVEAGEIEDLWDMSMKTWSDSLRIVKSAKYASVIHADALKIIQKST